jgi:hypothetical protein
MKKPKYVWNHKYGFWEDECGIMGYKWYDDRWYRCYVEPPADAPNCWYPQMAEQLVLMG